MVGFETRPTDLHSTHFPSPLVIRDSEGRSPFGRAATRVSFTRRLERRPLVVPQEPFLLLTPRLRVPALSSLNAPDDAAKLPHPAPPIEPKPRLASYFPILSWRISGRGNRYQDTNQRGGEKYCVAQVTTPFIDLFSWAQLESFGAHDSAPEHHQPEATSENDSKRPCQCNDYRAKKTSHQPL